MYWEELNAVTGLVSAACAIHGLVYFHKTNLSALSPSPSIFSKFKITAFLMGWSGWSLTCLCALWFFQPFGGLITSDEYKQFYAAVLSFPALALLASGLNLFNKKSNTGPQED